MGSVIEWLMQHEVASIAAPAVMRRGQAYAEDGRCSDLTVGSDGVLNATVTGSSGGAYKVIAIAGGPRLVANCGCPAARGRICKHIVCALLTLRAQLVLDKAKKTKRARGAAARVASDDGPKLGRFMSRQQLYDWGERHDVTHWLSVSVALVPHFLDEPREAVVDFLRRRMLPVAEFFGSDSRWSHVPARFVDDLVDFLTGRAERAATWRREDDARDWSPPAEPSLAHYAEELRNLRAVLRADGRAREPEARGPAQVTVEPWPPALVIRVEPPQALAGLGITTLPPVWMGSSVKVLLTPGDGPVELDPGQTEVPHAHQVEALELALDVLTEPRWADQAAALAQELATPPWRRALEQMRGHLVRAAPAPLVHGKESGELGWRIRLTRHDLEVAPVFIRPKKSGAGLVVRKLAIATLTREPRRWRHPADEHVIQQLVAGDHEAAYRAIQYLPQHPRVMLDPDTAGPVHVRRAALVQAVREDAGGARLGLELDGELLSLDDAAALIRRAHAGIAVDADPERRLVRVISVPPEAGALVDTWRALGDRLPAEALPELVGYLTEASAHVPVHVPEALTGDEVEAAAAPILQLEAPADGAVTGRLVVRPLAERASENPGMGPEKLLARRGDEVVHCVRDFAAELHAAGAAAAALGLPVHEEGLRHQWGFDAVDDVLDTLSNARAARIPVEWGGNERYHVGRSVRGSDLVVRAEGGSGRDWFSLEGEATGEDGAKVPLREILRALRERRRYVRLDDGSFAALDARLRRQLEALAATTAKDRLSALAAPVLAELAEVGVEVGGSEAWFSRLERLKEARDLDVPVPGELRGELRDYQREGFRWLSRLAHWSTGACLADDMGLGKTIQALALMLHRRAGGPQLVVAPTSLGFNWEREAERFAPDLRIQLFRGAQHQEMLTAELGADDVIVTSYDLAARYVDALKERTWKTVVLDEAQAIKNPETQRARAIFALDAEFVLALTGTPTENRTGEIWSLFRAIAPGLLGGKKAFRDNFAVPIERLGRVSAREALASLVQPFVLRRLKREVATELPPRTDVRLDVDLSAAERALYEELRAAAAESLVAIADGGTKEKDNPAAPQQRFMVLQALTRLRQLACHPRLVDKSSEVRSSKLAVLLELVEELRDEGHRALVFSQFTTLLDLVRRAFDEAGIRWRYLDGQTPAAQRRTEVDAFQAGDGDVFLLSLKAGGTGLNLTAADYVVHLDPWWNPAVEDQATDRAHRIGQDKPVTVYRLVARGTVEEGIMALHDEKRELAEALLAGTDAARALTVEELAALVRGTRETRGAVDSDEA